MGIFLEGLRTDTCHFKLSEKAIKVCGLDAQSYLHAQTTNNILKLLNSSFQFNSLLKMSGAIVSSFVLCKKDENTFYILIEESFINDTIERIEKFHISEDFAVEVIEQSTFLEMNSEFEEGAYTGSYFFEREKIIFSSSVPDSKTLTRENIQILKAVTGLAEFGVEVLPDTLINNTIFDELAIDYKKGCYLGQETVSKINAGRGALFKPMLLVMDGDFDFSIGVVNVKGKKVANILLSVSLDKKTYAMLALHREYRVENSKLTIIDDRGIEVEGTLSSYPYLSPRKDFLAEELYDYALKLFHQEDNQNAILYLKKAIKAEPVFESAYEALGVIYGRLGNYTVAIDLMEKLSTINPKCLMALTNLSLYHMKLGNIEIAEKYKTDATLLNFQILGDKAQVEQEKKKQVALEKAELKRRRSIYIEVLEMDPCDAMANYGMGEMESSQGHFEEAQRYFEKAIQTNKKYSVAYLGLVKALLEQKKLSLAKKTLLVGIETSKKNGDLMPSNKMSVIFRKNFQKGPLAS